MVDKEEVVVKKLKQYSQNHIIELLNKLDHKENLINQINEIDLNKIIDLYNISLEDTKINGNKLEKIDYLEKEKLSKKQKDKFNLLGEEIIKKGQYAVITMAGGQGTRLGHKGPKGTFKIKVGGKEKSLFEILAENLKEANIKYKIVIPWYIMTSKENNLDTLNFLEKNNYFGYPKDHVTLFIQGKLPLISAEGKLLIDKNMQIKEASDGNGSVFSSLKNTGILSKMKEKNIKWVFIGGVDNVLLKMVDITFLGMAIDKKVPIAAKSVVKENPHENVGVFCKMNGHPKVIEYSELKDIVAEEVDENGKLKYSEAHIMCNLFSIKAIEKISEKSLKYHKAFKKNSYINEDGREVIPSKPNSYKFESFIFDSFELFDDIAILRVKREDEFAPIKNKEGIDSPSTAQKLYQKYLEKNNLI